MNPLQIILMFIHNTSLRSVNVIVTIEADSHSLNFHSIFISSSFFFEIIFIDYFELISGMSR